MKLVLIVLLGFLVLSAIAGTHKWKTRFAAYSTLAVFAFLQMFLVLILLYRMKPPMGH